MEDRAEMQVFCLMLHEWGEPSRLRRIFADRLTAVKEAELLNRTDTMVLNDSDYRYEVLEKAVE